MLNTSVEILKEMVFSDGLQRRLEDFTYDDSEMAEVFFKLLGESDFTGISVSDNYTMLTTQGNEAKVNNMVTVSNFWVHKQKVVGLSPVTVIVLSPWVITPLNAGV